MCIYLGELGSTSLRPKPGIMVNKGKHPEMVLIQVSEITHMYIYIYTNVYIYIYCLI